MGKKNKRKQDSNNVQDESRAHENSLKGEEPPEKRLKDKTWFPGKYVLLNTPTSDASTNGIREETEATEKPKTSKKQSNGKAHKDLDHPRTAEVLHVNGENLKLKRNIEVISSSSEDNDYMEVESSDDINSMTDDEEVGEEWSTDTDYSEGDSIDEDEYSFHESDCESVSDIEKNTYINWSDEDSEDSDYVPEVEDKYVKRGEAVLYDAKGLNLAFGDSTKSQIVEITDITPAIMPKNDDDAPRLVTSEGEEIRDEELEAADPEEMIKNLQIDDGFRNTLLDCSATFFDCIKDQGVVLKISSTIHFHGAVIIRALANNVQVNGYTLLPHEVLSACSISRADYFLNLTPVVDSTCSNENISNEMKKLLKDEDAAALISSFNSAKEALIHLQHGPPDTTIEMLKNYSPNPLLPNKKMLMNNSSELILSAKFFVSSENQKVSTFQVNDQWNHVPLGPSSRLIVAGGKNVGKSGLCQFLVNREISKYKKILLIDLDIGQPICSPSQTVSATLLTKPIIGPGYLSRNQPYKCLMYGDKSVMISPFKYVRCVKQLVNYCSENPEFQHVPWIVNTMGYQKGFGLQLICLLTKILQPTDFVQIQHGVKSYNFAKVITEDIVNELEFKFFDADDVAGISTETSFTTHVLDSIVNNNDIDAASKWISNAAEKRKLSILAQLSRLLKDNQSCLNDVTPFVTPISNIRMVVIDEEYSQHEQGFNLELLNGNLVYLCHANNDETLNSTSILDCYGLGIVRGIDKINGKIFILLPQTDGSNQLQANVDVLAIGNIPLPSEILLKQSFNIVGSIPHVTFFRDRNASSKKYVNKRNIKDCY